MTTATATEVQKGTPVTQTPEEGKFSGDLRKRYQKVRSHVRRALFDVTDPTERRVRRNSAFVAADSLMQEIAPILERYKTDSLSGLNTKDGFNELLTLEAERAKRSGEKLTVLFLDLNKFKKVNDILGHDAGDAVIAQVGQLIKDSIRPTDVAARPRKEGEKNPKEEEKTNGHAGRIGGDEFTILLTGAGTEDVGSFFDRLSSRLPSIPIHQTLVENGINVSIACGASDVDLDNPRESVKIADQAMYEAKRMSRRRKNTSQIAIANK